MILLDEPCSALDPISTAKIEELIDVLKQDYTIAIVTHNMQQAARTSDFTAFMYLGELVEFDETTQDFHQSQAAAHAGLHHRPLRLSPWRSKETDRMDKQHEHIVRSYEEELALLNNKIAKMGGLAEQVLGQSIDALERRDPKLAAATISEDEAIDALEREIEEQAVVDDRAAPADGLRPAPDHGGAEDRRRPGAHRRSRQEHRQARAGRGRASSSRSR